MVRLSGGSAVPGKAGVKAYEWRLPVDFDVRAQPVGFSSPAAGGRRGLIARAPSERPRARR